MPHPDNRRVRRILVPLAIIAALLVYACAERMS